MHLTPALVMLRGRIVGVQLDSTRLVPTQLNLTRPVLREDDPHILLHVLLNFDVVLVVDTNGILAS